MTFSRAVRILGQRVRSVWRKEAVDAELHREFAFHFDQLVQEHIAAGVAPHEARMTAHQTLGNIALLEEECRDHRRVTWLHDCWQDLRYGIRMLRKNPGFTIVTAASLALGIGANTAILAVLDNVLLGNLPLPFADRLVVIRTYQLENPQQTQNASVPDYVAWKERTRSFESIGTALSDQKDFGIEADGTPAERVLGQAVSPSLFTTLGVQPMLGRVFVDAEDPLENPAPVIVISHQLWQRRFGGDPGILQKQVRLSGSNLTVIGVMPPEFRYPLETTEYWVPLTLNRFQLQGSARFFMVTARLKSEASVAQAQAELNLISAQLASEFPNRHRGWGIQVLTLRDFWFGWTKEPVLTLEGAVILVLMIACANVATLLLARGSVRQPEFALRAALGAGRGRIVRQLLTESVLLSVFGGAAGLLVAYWALRSLAVITPNPSGLHLGAIGLSPRMLALTGLVSILAGIVFGVAPALSGFPLKDSVRDAGTRSNRQTMRGTLVAVQIALALILLVGSGLLVNSVIRMVATERNFEPRGILTFEYRIPQSQYTRGLSSYRGMPAPEVSPPSLTMQRVYEQLRGLPGVESVAGISFAPVNSLVLPTLGVFVEGRPLPQSEAVVYFLVTPNLFATMKTPLVRGRDFDDRDTAAAPWVAVVNEAAARRLWPGENPMGKRFTLDAASGEQPREVVGVVRDVPLRYIRSAAEPVVYVSYLQQAERYRGFLANMFGQMTFLLRTSGDPMSLVSPARRAVANVDPDRPLANVAAMEQSVGGTLRDRAYYALVLGVFAFTATLLAAMGIYGVMAYSVAQRRREIGVRMALGASAVEVVQLIGRQALVLIVAGLGLGLAGSAALTRLISTQLWGVTPTDPLTFAGVSFLLVLVALFACLIPTRRAIRVDPTEALRTE